MAITDQQTPPTTEHRIEGRLAVWREHTAIAQEALADALALMAGKPLPSDTPVEMFATDVRPGDQILWQDGWWNVDTVHPGRGADAVLIVVRVGHAPLELRLAGNELLTTVRPS